MGRQHQGMDRPGVRQVPEGSGEQGKMEKTGCKIICGAPTTLAVKGLMMMMMMSIRHLLTVNATKTLLSAFILSKLDCCNSLLCGSSQFILDKLQRGQNSASRLVMKSCKCDHVQPLLRSLHWLPVHSRIDHKI